jgi:hypothetical protein
LASFSCRVSFLCALILFSRGGVGNHFEKKTAVLFFFESILERECLECLSDF